MKSRSVRDGSHVLLILTFSLIILNLRRKHVYTMFHLFMTLADGGSCLGGPGMSSTGIKAA